MKKIFAIQIPDNRNFGLDLLRFIAILTVLISHSITVLSPKYYLVHKFIFDGVLIFFVLSGFLIGRIMIRDFQDEINIKKLIHFWKRRWFRTLPAYYFTIFSIIFLYTIFGFSFNKTVAIKSLFFMQDIYFHYGGFFPESWSLSIEEWFYLGIPFIFFILYKTLTLSIRKNILIVFFIILIFSLIIRSYISYNTITYSVAEWDANLRSPVITRLDSLLMGVLGAWFFIYKIDFFKKNKNILFIMGIIIFISNKLYIDYWLQSFDGFYISVLYLTVAPFSVLLTIPALYYMNPPRSKGLTRIISIGSVISYSLYLVNLTIVSYTILQPLNLNMWIKFVLFWLLTILFSILMYKYIETPFMKLRDKKLK